MSGNYFIYQLFATSCRLAYINVSDAADSQHAREMTNDSCQIKYALHYAVLRQFSLMTYACIIEEGPASKMARNSIFLPVPFVPV